MSVDILILGAGWTSTFLIPLCEEAKLTTAATSRSGSGRLPDAKTVLITFPVTVPGASERLVRLYLSTRQNLGEESPAFIQLGSTSIWNKAGTGGFIDRHSQITPTGRSIAETELLALSPSVAATTVLNLGGLWGGQRIPRNWLSRVAPTKEALAEKGSLHLLHGLDLARAILAVHSDFPKAAGQRWLLTDGRVYDWWDLAYAWGAEEAVWVRELMEEHNVRVLPRNTELLGRVLDSRTFGPSLGLLPLDRGLG
ncbi:hypothetical protein R3P38DRAFT_3326060 [Favolaschia claudopus]|uniref:Uncharacterized protein n=1 Tax=Favolaschia claudopus TaxID=2862362 RepID=A0AAW0AAR1_9AGAR